MSVLLSRPARLAAAGVALCAALAYGLELYDTFTQYPDRPLTVELWRQARYFTYLTTLLILIAFVLPDQAETMAEIEPFKTAITVSFQREWLFVGYAVFWLILGTVFFKGFCRYVCPLGALLALGDALRIRRWIPRREECGSPCRLCEARCRYQAIERSGRVRDDECFHCLDCVTIHDDRAQCVPLILAARRAKAGAAPLKMPEPAE